MPNKITSQSEIKIENPKWKDFIIQVLQEKQKPLSRIAIMQLYNKQYHNKILNSECAKSSLAGALNKLGKNKKIESLKLKKGSVVLYALAEWNIKSSLKTKPEKIVKAKQNPGYRTYDWNNFIIETLNEAKRIMSIKEFLDFAVMSLSIPEYKIVSSGNKLSRTLMMLVKKEKTLKIVKKEGQKIKSFGLTKWFDDEGNLIVEYK